MHDLLVYIRTYCKPYDSFQDFCVSQCLVLVETQAGVCWWGCGWRIQPLWECLIFDWAREWRWESLLNTAWSKRKKFMSHYIITRMMMKSMTSAAIVSLALPVPICKGNWDILCLNKRLSCWLALQLVWSHHRVPFIYLPVFCFIFGS